MNRNRSRQAGVSAVEFTIALPMLLFLFLAVAEFGRAFLQYNTLTRAVRDSARYVASNAIGNSTGVVTVDAALIAAARNLVVYGNEGGTGPVLLPGIAPANVTITNVGSNNVRVSASYTYQPMIGTAIPDMVRGGSIATTFTLTSQVIVRAIS